MGKIFMIMGKSASGKDTVYKRLLADEKTDLSPIILYTTRPMRKGEKNGKEYFFSDQEHLESLRRQGRIIEERVYHTVHGDWYYFTADEGQITPQSRNYLTIGTLQSFVKMRQYFGAGIVRPLYIETDDHIRLTRAIEREKTQENPAYKEVCRRYLADEEDFSEEKLANAGVRIRFPNNADVRDCIEKVKEYIEREMMIDE